ncbi:MAG: sulfur carrier protein ThiS [bacterium]
MGTVTINGVERLLGDAKTLAELFEALGVQSHKKAVEKNGEIIPSTSWASTSLQSGDTLEIIQFVGGG